METKEIILEDDSNRLDLNRFMQAPKELIGNKYFNKNELSSLARLVYIDMFDLLRVSVAGRKLIDEKDKPYIYYTKKTIIEKFEVNDRTASKAFNELLDLNLIEIYEEDYIGCRLMYRIYPKAITEYVINTKYGK